MSKDEISNSREDWWIEGAYRRGFHQGVAAVMEALEAGASPDEIKAYERRIRGWRSKVPTHATAANVFLYPGRAATFHAPIIRPEWLARSAAFQNRPR